MNISNDIEFCIFKLLDIDDIIRASPIFSKNVDTYILKYSKEYFNKNEDMSNELKWVYSLNFGDKITKSQAKENFKVTDKQLEDLKYESVYSYNYKSYVYLYSKQDISKLCFQRHKNLNGLKGYKDKLQVRRDKRNKTLKIKKDKLEERTRIFNEMLKTFTYLSYHDIYNIKEQYTNGDISIIETQSLLEEYNNKIGEGKRKEIIIYKAIKKYDLINVDIDDSIINKYISGKKTFENTMNILIKLYNERTKRKIELSEKLNKMKLELRNDSYFCNSYIYNNRYNVDDVVNKMCEAKYLHEYCDIKAIYTHYNFDYYYDGEKLSKEEANKLALRRTKLKTFPIKFPWLDKCDPLKWKKNMDKLIPLWNKFLSDEEVYDFLIGKKEICISEDQWNKRYVEDYVDKKVYIDKTWKKNYLLMRDFKIFMGTIYENLKHKFVPEVKKICNVLVGDKNNFSYHFTKLLGKKKIKKLENILQRFPNVCYDEKENRIIKN